VDGYAATRLLSHFFETSMLGLGLFRSHISCSARQLVDCHACLCHFGNVLWLPGIPKTAADESKLNPVQLQFNARLCSARALFIVVSLHNEKEDIPQGNLDGS
jgi:hypothetical protein